MRKARKRSIAEIRSKFSYRGGGKGNKGEVGAKGVELRCGGGRDVVFGRERKRRV